jgi:acetyl/propionyl-CoA carboxylase alpha subunit
VKLSFSHAGQHHAVEVQQNGREYKASKDGKSVVASILDTAPGEIHLRIDGADWRVLWARHGRKIWLHFDGRSYYVEKQAGSAVAGGAATSGERTLRAPMPGQVRQVLVENGQAVKAGETLVLLEAMKMEIRILSPGDGKVARVAVKQGQSVEKEQVLVQLEAEHDR